MVEVHPPIDKPLGKVARSSTIIQKSNFKARFNDLRRLRYVYNLYGIPRADGIERPATGRRCSRLRTDTVFHWREAAILPTWALVLSHHCHKAMIRDRTAALPREISSSRPRAHRCSR